MIRKISLGMLLCVILLGCTGDPDKSKWSRDDMQKEVTHEEEWSKVPALRRIPVSSDLFLARSVRPPMPNKSATQQISLRFNKGNATVNDLIGILDLQGIPVIIRPTGGSGASSDDISDMVLPFRRYDGTLGNLVKKIARSLDLSVWWENDALLISDRDRYVVSVPQQQDVIDTVVGELEDFGAEDISPSLYGGRIIYSARPQVNEEVVVPYLNGLAGNLAEITLQVAVVQLQLTDVSQRGIDWSSFQLQFGDPAIAAANAAASAAVAAASAATGTGTTGATTPTTTTIQSTTVGSVINSLGGGNVGQATGTNNVANAGGSTGTLSGQGLAKIAGTKVGISGAIQYLSQFGRTSTKQMVELRTLAGQPVQLVSSQTTPYVKGLSSTTNVGGATGSGTSNNVTSSVDTATIDTGLTMGFTPFYDSLMGLVVVDVNIQVSSLLALETLSYGNTSSTTGGGGSIQQPKTSKNQITDIVRIPAGEVVILGGLHEEDKAESRTAPFDAFDALGSKSTNNTDTLTFFIMRPVVTIFDPKGASVNTVLPGDGIDASEKVSEEASDADVAPVAALPPARSEKRNIKKLDDGIADDHPELPNVAKAPFRKSGAHGLEDLLQNGFAGPTGLETQGGL